MSDPSTTTEPPGWTSNPSRFRTRILPSVLALAGLGISIYLALYQYGVVSTVWEPFFGNGSRYMLRRSGFSELFPGWLPDAVLGAVNYSLDLVFGLPGPADRWRARPWLVLAFAAVVYSMAVFAVGLTILQGAVYARWCTLCLLSAATATVIAPIVLPETLAALQGVTRARRRGAGLAAALAGRRAS